MGNAVRLFADGHTFGAIIHFAGLIRAHDLTVGFLTLHIADCILRLLAR